MMLAADGYWVMSTGQKGMKGEAKLLRASSSTRARTASERAELSLRKPRRARRVLRQAWRIGSGAKEDAEDESLRDPM
eukprot:14012306-Alexandrium_andersonii.AAC.1